MTDATREQLAAALKEVEAALEKWVNIDQGQPTMLTGYVVKLRGKNASNFESEDRGSTTSAWLCPDEQDVFTTLGLASALGEDVAGYYVSLHDEDDD